MGKQHVWILDDMDFESAIETIEDFIKANFEDGDSPDKTDEMMEALERYLIQKQQDYDDLEALLVNVQHDLDRWRTRYPNGYQPEDYAPNDPKMYKSDLWGNPTGAGNE